MEERDNCTAAEENELCEGNKNDATSPVENINLHNYIKTQLDVLQCEYIEENKRYKVMSQDSSVLEKQGLALRNMAISSLTIGQYGLIVIGFVSVGIKKIPVNQIGVGDIVGISASNNSSYELDSTAYTHCDIWGCVEAISDDGITVAVEKFKQLEQVEESLFLLRKLPSNVTFNRMKTNLKRMSKFPKDYKYMTDLFFNDGELEQVSIPPQLLNLDGDLTYYNPMLHATQKSAIKFALSQKHLAVIHGPPGTGKTTVLAELIHQLTVAGEKVLVCAPSNVAVDNIMDKCLSYKMDLVRFGHPGRIALEFCDLTIEFYMSQGFSAETLKEMKGELCTVVLKLMGNCKKKEVPALREKIKDLRQDIKRRERKIAKEALLGVNCCFVTLGSAYPENVNRFFPEGFFSTVVIDECSQALEAASWMAIPYAKRCIMAGDYLQLPPVVLSKEGFQLDLDKTLMERAINLFGSKCYRLLTQQFRMNQDIVAWVSHEMYNGLLTSDCLIAHQLLVDLPDVTETEETEIPLVLVDTSGCNLTEHSYHSSYGNEGEADLAAFLASNLVIAGVSQEDVAIITPYKRQVEVIKNSLYRYALNDIEVQTVDGFQGREMEAVILSLVRSNSGGEIGFLSDRRRMNVAVSRARRFLCVIANVDTVQHDLTCNSLITHISKVGDVRSAHRYKDEVISTKMSDPLQKSSIHQKKTKKMREKKDGQFAEKLAVDAIEMRKVVLCEDHSVLIEVSCPTDDFRKLNFANKPDVVKKHDEMIEDSPKLDSNSHVEKSVGSPKAQLVELKNQHTKICDKQTLFDIEELKLHLEKFLLNQNKQLIVTCNLNVMEVHCIEYTANHMGLEMTTVEHSRAYTNLIFKKINQLSCSNTVENRVICNVVPFQYRLSCADKEKSSNNEEPLQEGDCFEVEQKCLIKEKQKKKNKKVAKVNDAKEDGHNGNEVKGYGAKGKKVSTDSTDEFLDEIIKQREVCAVTKCKTSVRMIGHDCSFCRRRYCIAHTLPEVHGCTDGAREAARKAFMKPAPKPLTQERKRALKKSLGKKLSEMSSVRKGSTS